MSVRKPIGNITAYAAAVEGGYTGTYEQFCSDQANFAKNAQSVAGDRAAVERLKNDTQNIKDAAVADLGAAKETALGEITSEKEAGLTAVLNAGTEQVRQVENAADAKKQEIAGMDAVQFAQQNKSESEKSQARTNIGAASANEVNQLSEEVARCLSLESDDADVISDGTDFDTLTEPRTYKVRTWSSGNTMINSPNKNSGRLIVMRLSERATILQVYIANASDSFIFVRHKDGSLGWSEWVSFATSDDVNEMNVKLSEEIELDRAFMGVVAKTIMSDDLFPRVPSAWKIGTDDEPNTKKRLQTTDFIDISNVDKIGVEFLSDTPLEIWVDVYTGNATDGYTFAYKYGWYSEDNWFWGSHLNYTAMKISLRHSDDSALTIDEAITAPIKLTKIGEQSDAQATSKPVKLRVMQYNIGKFNMGFGHDNPHITSEEVVAKIANYKRFFGEYQPDILGIQEFTDYIDCTDSEFETNNTLFDDVFPYSTTPYYGNILKSDIVPYIAENIILDEGADHSQPAVKAKYLINGKVLGVIVGTGDWRDECSAHRKPQLNDAMARLSDCDHAIICIDWNVKSQEEFDDLVGEAESAGYTVANGGYFGSFETYGNDNCYRCIDQILCKGAKIKNVLKPNVYDNLASDHFPLIADIILI